MTAVTPHPEQRLSTTMTMSLAAVVAALIAMFGHSETFTPLTAAMALAGLVPWALIAGGVRLPLPLFHLLVIVPVAVMVLVDRNPGGLFPVMLAIVWICRSTSNRWMIGATLLAGASITVLHAVFGGDVQEDGAIYFLGGIGVSWMTGTMLRRQEVLVAEVRAAHEQQARHDAESERTRIAREVHDVVAHSLTVTMLHVTGARRALSHDPERAAEALERAETVGRESLDSIRQVVGLLRADPAGATDGSSDGGTEPPLPAVADIAPLVEQFRSAGLDVVADLRLDDLLLDPTTSLTAFRVVQEALSNVLQHAPGAPVELRVASDHDGAVLRIVSENPAVAPVPSGERSGLGLRGMTERVRAAGGSVEVGPTTNHTFRIEAVLPLRRSHATA